MAFWSNKSAIWFAKISRIQRFCSYSAKIMWYRFTRGDAYALPISNCFWAFSPRVEQKVRNAKPKKHKRKPEEAIVKPEEAREGKQN